ncbi:pyruvate formate lyase activating enzyme [Caloramator quimbayensis]|uniref:Pyruvate formate lyase activating enzyme n=1 Tax=Caloramator quimbayensis TaxID=1147123 RepID=A0A1T4WMU9_9CLOT|nr:[formate-C-acetyltransferase]-activating enzyme [Caloramator quimbayensis]SKA78690.1 pyruvate formate lyase activating enzyme [Caloramator quimbayensis]
MKAMIFNIQRYSLHDGEGIRTVIFFKGCPLTCPWCSNPESQKLEKEIMRRQSLCIGCSSTNCYKCNKDPKDCPTGALERIGKEMTLREVLDEVNKDAVFFDSTGGGVTLSGGEPLLQGEFIVELLKELKKIGIHTAIETTGMGRQDIIIEMSKHIDTVLWDFKIMDKRLAKEVVNQDIDVMKNNFETLIKNSNKVEVIPRIPLIPHYTANIENIQKILDYISKFDLKLVHILPFHQYGSSKYKALGEEYKLKDVKTLDKNEIEEINKFIECKGFKVIIGG